MDETPIICASCQHSIDQHDDQGCWTQIFINRKTGKSRSRRKSCPCTLADTEVPDWAYDEELDDIVHVSEYAPQQALAS